MNMCKLYGEKKILANKNYNKYRQMTHNIKRYEFKYLQNQ